MHPGRFGSQYPRVLIDESKWMVVYTVYRNMGYLEDKSGGNELAVAISNDQGVSWKEIAVISDPGRDLDNGQMLLLDNGDILLACRSVIWQQSYTLPVYVSKDGGYTWQRRSIIDENHGGVGELGNPDRGVYEPHLFQLDKNRIAVFYASEKYACDMLAFSQIIVEKVTDDDGKTWSDEIWAVHDEYHDAARPGMSVCDRMKDGTMVLVYEIIATHAGDVFFKTSNDGIHWEKGIGKRIPEQKGGAFVLAMDDDTLLVTSNTHHVSLSYDKGKTWVVNAQSPWETLFTDMVDNGATCTIENGNVWPSLYKIDDRRFLYITSVGRQDGGNNIQFRIGELEG